MSIIIRKTKINWLLQDNCIIAFDKLQATCYNILNGQNKKNFDLMTNLLAKSSPDEYNNWVDAICLAQDMEMIGYGTRVRQEWF